MFRMDDEFRWLAPMVLWPFARRILPPNRPRPQGGGAQRSDERAMFAAVSFILVTGLPWRNVPPAFRVSWQNAHRRFQQWSEAGLWRQLAASADDGTAGPGSDEAYWAVALERAAELRLQKPAEPVTSGTTAGSVPVWGKPVIRRAKPNLVRRLFGHDQHPGHGDAIG
jgi:hypothetical protein